MYTANILRKIYDKNSHIECELIAYALNNIVYDALHEKINVTSKLRGFCLYKLEGKRRRRYGRTYSGTVS